MKLVRMALLLGMAMVTAKLAGAQVGDDWVPQSVAALRQEASSKTEFSLDHSMLVFASKLDPDDPDLQRVIAGVSGLTVHNYRFAVPWAYDPAALSSVKQEYHQAGWKQVLNNHARDGGPGATEIWVRLEHRAVSDVAILVASAKDVSLIDVSCSISPLDLLRLSGHFGIPQMGNGAQAPNTRDEQR